jgi:hypothetical protein
MIEEWRNELILDQRGKIWWYNFQYDLTQSNLPSEIDEYLSRAIRELLESDAGKISPLDVLLSVLTRSPADFDLKGHPVTETEPLSRVIDARSLAYFHLDYESLGLETSETLEIEIWKRFKDRVIDPERYYRGELRSSRNFFWGTLTRRLEEIFELYQLYSAHDLESEDLAATEIRNLLGLSYMSEGVGLYRIDIPLELLPEGHICSPTTLDSSPYCVFLPAKNDSRFGLTVHLSKLEPGAEEFVIKPIPLTKECRVIQIGFVRGPLPDSDQVWSTIEQVVESRLLPTPKRGGRRRKNG